MIALAVRRRILTVAVLLSGLMFTPAYALEASGALKRFRAVDPLGRHPIALR